MTWQKSLRLLLSPRPDGRPPRLAIIGVGQSLRGDDGVGSALARQLAGQLADDALLIIDAGHAPENCLGPVVRFRPDVILFLDAARGGSAPGDILWLLPAEADGRGGSTHALSLEMLADYLTAETGAVVRVLGIEPSGLAFGEALSPAVVAAAAEAAATLVAYWRKPITVASAMASGD